MGTYAVLCAVEQGISRAEQDEYAAASYSRAKDATEQHKFREEIVAMKELDHDEETFARSVSAETLAKLRPAFKLPHTHRDLPSKNSESVTPGNSSTMSDGAAALVLVSRKYAEDNHLQVLATIKGWGNASQIPEKFTTSPKFATDKALKHAGLGVNDIDYFEVNEAFAVVPIATAKLLGVDWKKNVNVYGGAVSMGHPLGCSGKLAAFMYLLTHILSFRRKNHRNIAVNPPKRRRQVRSGSNMQWRRRRFCFGS